MASVLLMTSGGRLGSGEHVHPRTGVDPSSSPTSSLPILKAPRPDLSAVQTIANTTTPSTTAGRKLSAKFYS